MPFYTMNNFWFNHRMFRFLRRSSDSDLDITRSTACHTLPYAIFYKHSGWLVLCCLYGLALCSLFVRCLLPQNSKFVSWYFSSTKNCQNRRPLFIPHCLCAGAGKGIGEATAKLLAAHGAAVVVCDLDAAAAKEVAAAITVSQLQPDED